MANGKQHGNATRFLASTLMTSHLVYTHSHETLALYVGCLFGLICDPDLDIDHKTESEQRVYRFNRVLGFLWHKFWLPYALLIPHRHWSSHLPVVSTLIRHLYIFLLVWFVGMVFTVDPMWFEAIPIEPTTYAYFLAGNIASDVGHWILDQSFWLRRFFN